MREYLQDVLARIFLGLLHGLWLSIGLWFWDRGSRYTALVTIATCAVNIVWEVPEFKRKE